MRTLTAIAALSLALSSGCAADEPVPCFPLGHDDDAPRRASTGEKEQGTKLQGERDQGTTMQGMETQGQENQGITEQGATLSLSELAGVRLELAASGEAVALHDGRLVAGELEIGSASQGATLVATTSAGRRIPIAITSVTRTGGSERIALAANGWTVCAPGNEGMFVPGSWDESGAHRAERGALTYSCMDGVIAKCVDWGYAPWTVGSELHATCTRLARADYCGDGRSWTMNGTMIDVYDTLGVQTTVHDPDFRFEAAWSEDGAVCVNAARYDILDEEGESVVPECFAALPRCTSLAEATELGATMANESAHTEIDACPSGI